MSADKHLEIVELSLATAAAAADDSVAKIKAATAAFEEKAPKTFKANNDKENQQQLKNNTKLLPKVTTSNNPTITTISTSTKSSPISKTTVRLASPTQAAGQEASSSSSATGTGTGTGTGSSTGTGTGDGSVLRLQSYVSNTGNGVYKIIKTLGKGNFAKVKLALHVPTGREVAIKVIDKTQLNTSARQKLYREVRIMKLLNHPNIVRLFQVIESERTLYLIMEYASRGELFDHLVKNGRMREREARQIFRQLVSAIQYCHSKYVVHRDLKAENLLLDQHMNIKIADFGFGNTFDPNAQLETFCGSPPYAAPELFMGRKYAGPEVDSWSLGVVLYTLVSGSLPFDGGTLKELRERVLRGKYRVPYYISMDCENLMRKFLVLNPSKRASLNAVMADKWINLGLEETDRLRPFREKPMELQDVPRLDALYGMGYKRRDVETSLKSQAFDDIYCTYMLLGIPKMRRNESSSANSGPPPPAVITSTLDEKQRIIQRPMPPRVANALASPAPSNAPGSAAAAVAAAPPAKPTRRTPARKASAAPSATGSHASPQTPQSAKRTVSCASAAEVKPTLLSAQRQLAQAQKLANTPPRFQYMGSGRRPTTLYEKGESAAAAAAAATAVTKSTTTQGFPLPKSPIDGRLLERLHISTTCAAASATPTLTPKAPQSLDKPFTRSNVARATFHFGQGRSSSSSSGPGNGRRNGKHGRCAGNSAAEDDDPPLSADDTKPASRVGFFSKLTARFGRRVIQLNEKDVSEQRKNLTK